MRINMKLKKLSEILVIFASLWFIMLGVIKYYFEHSFSSKQFISVILFFSICILSSLLFLFGKISSLKDILTKKDNKSGDIIIGVIALVFGIFVFYDSISLRDEWPKKLILLIGSSVFTIMAVVFLLIKTFESRLRTKENQK